MIPQLHVKVVTALIRAGRPLTLSELAREASVPKQNLEYHLPILIAHGLILPLENGTYATQRLFRDRRMLDLSEPLIYHAIGHVDASSADDAATAVLHVLACFFAMQKLTKNGGP